MTHHPIFYFIFFIFVTRSLTAYDASFSDVFDQVYPKYHTKEGDWCDQLGQQVSAVTASKGRSVSYKELAEAGIDSDYLDAMALEYCVQHKDFHMAIVWPTVGHEREGIIYDIMQADSIVGYHKKFNLRGNAPVELLKLIPEKISTYREHFTNYFPERRASYPLMCFILRTKTLADTRKIKLAIRKLYNVESFHIHISDTYEESLLLAQTLLNNNSLHFLNFHNFKNYRNFEFLLDKYKRFINEKNISNDDICIDGSCVLSAYGIRDTALDLDFLYTKEPEIQNISPLDHHNKTWEKLGFDVSEVIYNPKHFFFYRGLKFTSLPVLREFKERQGRAKDLADVKSINLLMK